MQVRFIMQRGKNLAEELAELNVAKLTETLACQVRTFYPESFGP